MKTAVLVCAAFAGLWGLSGLIIWICWDWFGATAINAAMPGLGARPIDFWAALGLGFLVTLFVGGSRSSSSSKSSW